MIAYFIQGLFVFLAMFATDVCWATYIGKVGDKKVFQSTLWAVLLYLTGVVGTISIIGNHWMLIPATLGCAAGTFCAVKWRKE